MNHLNNKIKEYHLSVLNKSDFDVFLMWTELQSEQHKKTF